jgi:hypothetical protein
LRRRERVDGQTLRDRRIAHDTNRDHSNIELEKSISRLLGRPIHSQGVASKLRKCRDCSSAAQPTGRSTAWRMPPPLAGAPKIEAPRDISQLSWLSPTPVAGSPGPSQSNCSNSTGGMSPMGMSSRSLLNKPWIVSAGA